MLILMISLTMVFGSTLSLAATSSDVSVTQCVLDNPSELKTVRQAPYNEGILFNINTHPCSGGVYLAQVGGPQHHILAAWEGWWLQGLYKPAFIETPSGTQLQVTGSFLAGVGPSGMEPFTARVSFLVNGDPQSDVWQTLEPDVDIPTPEQPRSYAGGFEVRSQAELEALTVFGKSLSQFETPFADVDFETERLFLRGADLYSGDTAVVDHVNATYRLVPTNTRNFNIGPAFTVPGALWMIVPKDEDLIGFGPVSQETETACATCRAGAWRMGGRLQAYAPVR